MAASGRRANGKMHSHQRWLKPVEAAAATRALLDRFSAIDAANTFEELRLVVEELKRFVGGVDEMYCYDIAERIGAKKGTLPEHVYLHRGTRDGARALGINVDGRVFLKKLSPPLPEEFLELEADEIEDVLCLYKDYFLGVERDLDQLAACLPDDPEE